MDQQRLDLSKARFSPDDSISDTELSDLNEARTLEGGVQVSYRDGNWVVKDENGAPLPKHIVTVADPAMGERSAFVWLCYELPDGSTNCIRVKAGGIHTHTAY